MADNLFTTTDTIPRIEFSEPAQPAPNAVPSNPAFEEAICAAVRIGGLSQYHTIAPYLPEGSAEFYNGRAKLTWQACEQLAANRIEIDLMTLTEQLDTNGNADVGGSAYLSGLISVSPSTLNSEYYAKIVHDYFVRRTILTAANKAATLAYDMTKQIDEVGGLSISAMTKAAGKSALGKMVTMREAVARADAMVQARADSDILPGIPTGFTTSMFYSVAEPIKEIY